MIAEAIDKLLELYGLENHVVLDEHGNQYTDKSVRRIKTPEQVSPDTIEMETLTGMRGFTAECSPEEKDLFLHVVSYKEVRLIGAIQPKNDNTRFVYAKSHLTLDGFRFGHFFDLETFIISLQSHFVPNKQIETILNYLGKVASEHVKENKDDGFSQSIQVRVGIRTKEEVKIENPMWLQPWRTFREVDQPVSPCVLRLRNNIDLNGITCGLFTADGNTWQLEAIGNIKEWLKSNIPGVPVVA